MTEQELLDSYGFEGVPDDEKQKYLRHIADLICDPKTTALSREHPQKSEVRQGPTSLAIRLASALRQSRAVTHELLLLAEECIPAWDEQ